MLELPVATLAFQANETLVAGVGVGVGVGVAEDTTMVCGLFVTVKLNRTTYKGGEPDDQLAHNEVEISTPLTVTLTARLGTTQSNLPFCGPEV